MADQAPGWWHVAMRASRCEATEVPVQAADVPAVLEAWGFVARQWYHGPVGLSDENRGWVRELGSG